MQRLLDQNISSKNITLKGHSIGAGIASLVALHFHKQGQPINVFNGRSFSSITNVLVGQIRGGHQETFSGKVRGWIAKPFIKLALTLSKWEINADDAFQAIPNAYREYVLVRTPKEQRNETVVDDQLISHYASMHAALKPERRAQKAALDHLISVAKLVKKQADPLTQPDLDNAATQLVQARAKFKERKMINQIEGEAPAHNIPLPNLVNRYGKTALTFFNEFVERAYNDHGVKPTIEAVI